MKVRVLDDTEDMTVLVQAVLKGKGFDVTTTNRDFGDLLDVEKWKGYDAALIDLLWADPTSSMDVIRWLAAEAPWVRIIVLSAIADLRDDPEGELQQLADVVLNKPAHPHVIIRALSGQT